jgi:hypothetical protein
MSRKVRGEEHPATLMVMANLASAWHRTGRSGEAETLYTRALSIAERILPEGHTATASIRLDLANFYEGQMRFDEAELLFQKCIAGLESNLGPRHPMTVSVIQALIAHYERSGTPEQSASWKARLATAGELPVPHPRPE